MADKITITKLGISKSGKSVKAISESDLKGIKKYQAGLIDYLLYSTNARNNPHGKQEMIIEEIRRCEIWLKKNYTNFINSKIKFEAA